MPFVCPNLVFETTTYTGTDGVMTLLGAVGDFLDFDSQSADNDTVPYTIEFGGHKEVCLGIFNTSGPTLSRSSILFTTNGDAAVDFTAGTKNVYSGIPGELLGSLMDPTGSNGFIAQTTTNTYARRTLIEGNGITITEESGAGGNPTIDASFLNTRTGAAITPTDSRMDRVSYVSDFSGADPTGVSDSTTALQAACTAGGRVYLDGKYLVSDSILCDRPIQLLGFGMDTSVIVDSAMSASTDVFTISPDLAEDKYFWEFYGFVIIPESGTPGRHAFNIDITTVNKFLAKCSINVMAFKLGGNFIELTNPVNEDGLFVSKFSDNWCEGGFNLSDIGDSVFFERNTISGTSIGPAFVVDQLDDSSVIVLEKNNCTASGGLASITQARNIIIKENTVECVNAFDGDNNAAISIDNSHSAFSWATKILNNNINTHGNVTSCVFVGAASNTLIDGNTLFADPATDAHITIDTDAYNTEIGAGNVYHSSVSGAIVTPIIVNNGVGTKGILISYTLSLGGWALIDAVNDHPLEYIKSRDGLVTIFGRIDGTAAGVAATLFTLPLGFRPTGVVHLIAHDITGTPFRVQVLPTGPVQVTDGGAESLQLDGLSWISLPVAV